jgi:hypothetical protein
MNKGRGILVGETETGEMRGVFGGAVGTTRSSGRDLGLRTRLSQTGLADLTRPLRVMSSLGLDMSMGGS